MNANESLLYVQFDAQPDLKLDLFVSSGNEGMHISVCLFPPLISSLESCDIDIRIQEALLSMTMGLDSVLETAQPMLLWTIGGSIKRKYTATRPQQLGGFPDIYAAWRRR
ncbi:hypothetical protein BKA70DRAFT_1427692 [Coprinopsis sp. MPI-PUGE-AT-0042]|nr:hypothetical protein BKA70DRAFT_1427692 [Coprinopsis sp. MPI-PUGE-AT-0042]